MWVCPGCHEQKQPTKHHVFPRRHFGRKSNNNILKLCKQCHQDLEKMIPYEKMPREFYREVINEFFERRVYENIQTSKTFDILLPSLQYGGIYQGL